MEEEGDELARGVVPRGRSAQVTPGIGAPDRCPRARIAPNYKERIRRLLARSPRANGNEDLRMALEICRPVEEIDEVPSYTQSVAPSPTRRGEAGITLSPPVPELSRRRVAQMRVMKAVLGGWDVTTVPPIAAARAKRGTVAKLAKMGASQSTRLTVYQKNSRIPLVIPGGFVGGLNFTHPPKPALRVLRERQETLQYPQRRVSAEGARLRARTPQPCFSVSSPVFPSKYVAKRSSPLPRRSSPTPTQPPPPPSGSLAPKAAAQPPLPPRSAPLPTRDYYCKQDLKMDPPESPQQKPPRHMPRPRQHRVPMPMRPASAPPPVRDSAVIPLRGITPAAGTPQKKGKLALPLPLVPTCSPSRQQKRSQLSPRQLATWCPPVDAPPSPTEGYASAPQPRPSSAADFPEVETAESPDGTLQITRCPVVIVRDRPRRSRLGLGTNTSEIASLKGGFKSDLPD
eukprot:Hpha_TRINITY_DN29998_c0_g1::TRINITY_DN29998_c0_g1_i1::g.131846::m.131846